MSTPILFVPFAISGGTLKNAIKESVMMDPLPEMVLMIPAKKPPKIPKITVVKSKSYQFIVKNKGKGFIEFVIW